MKFLNNINLNTRLNILIIGILIIILTVLGVYIYQNQRTKIVNDLDKQMEIYLNDVDYLIREKIEQREKTLQKAVEYFVYEIDAKKIKDSTILEIDESNSYSTLKNNYNLHKEVPKEIQSYFSNKSHLNINYHSMLIYKNGKQLLTNTLEERDIANTKLFNAIKFISDHEIHKIKYKWPEDETGTTHYMYLKYLSSHNAYVAISAPEKILFKNLYKLRNILLVGILIAVLILSFTLSFIVKSITQQIVGLSDIVRNMANGKIADKIEYKRNDEIGEIISSLNMLIDGLKRTTEFSKQIGEGNLEAEYTPLSNEDDLGNSLLEMRESLRVADEERKKKKEEEEKRTWSTAGHAKFADILRNNTDNIDELSFNVISELVKYLDIIQGGIFILMDEDKEEPYLKLTGCYAYDRRKYVKKTVLPGEGLTGMCYLEGETIYMSEVPDGYMDIVSGLGESDPQCLLLAPLKINEDIFGVIELASLEKMDEYKIEFVEKVGEIIASTISTVKTHMKTNSLLEQFQQQSEEMKSKEEELRQNMEELQTTQEEAARREAEMQGMIEAINSIVGIIEMDMEGKILKANDLYCKLFYSSHTELKDKNIKSFMEKDVVNSDKFKEIWNDLQEGKVHAGGHHYINKGKDIWVYECFSPVKDANNNYFKIIGVAHDISLIRQKEKRLQELEQLLKEIQTKKNTDQSEKKQKEENTDNSSSNKEEKKTDNTTAIDKLSDNLNKLKSDFKKGKQ